MGTPHHHGQLECPFHGDVGFPVILKKFLLYIVFFIGTKRLFLLQQTVTSPPGVDHFPGPLHHRSTILSALGPDHALTVLFLGTHEQLPSGSPIMGLLSRATCLTSEFLRNPKPVSSQKVSC
ncbi:hypothetical protein DVH24_023557 [Malus domestica]|uniref:Uncharacterized protein n=1 Tax=Malus domestica TaxID=3750 RepID=A0A498I871_MALDO|nr:hypothetical protein DVH24_023557 [Malus domestica]